MYVNGQEIHIVKGMTVRHALIAADLLCDIESGKKAYDDKGNEVGLGGALTEGSRIYVK